MDIKISNINFTNKTNLSKLKHKQIITAQIRAKNLSADTFIRTTFDIKRDLSKLKLREKINEGHSAEVYNTNYDGYVIRLMHGKIFDPKKLKAVNDPNGLILAADDSDSMRLMKFVKGEPLYGNNWRLTNYVPKRTYMKFFHRVIKLPDESFSKYIQDVLNIRKNGYDIDIINPNNYLLDGNNIGIVDIEKNYGYVPDMDIWDFDPLVNKCHLLNVFKSMDVTERLKFTDEIKSFYDRIIEIAKKEGQEITIPKADKYSFAMKIYLVNYLYHKNWKMLSKLMKKELG